METGSRDSYLTVAKSLMAECDDYRFQEDIAQHITQRIYDTLSDSPSHGLVLTRIYRMTRVEDLPVDLLAQADREDRYVVTLLGTYGRLLDWCHRKSSVAHQIISINSIAIPARIPMFEHLLVQNMGVDLNKLYETGNVIASMSRPGGGKFHIEDVPSSPIIPAQVEFVRPFGVKSLVGFGGLIGDAGGSMTLYMLIAFTSGTYTADMADDFNTMQPYITTCLASAVGRAIFH